jgi:hypothetical protein
VLLSSFEEWTRPVETVFKGMKEVMFELGDLLLEYRARQWTRSDSGLPSLESRRVREGEPVFGNYAYRLTTEGRRRLERGLSHVGDAPTFEVGGTTAYARERPWTVVEDGDGWSWKRAAA